jgi:hypothetical protein
VAVLRRLRHRAAHRLLALQQPQLLLPLIPLLPPPHLRPVVVVVAVAVVVVAPLLVLRPTRLQQHRRRVLLRLLRRLLRADAVDNSAIRTTTRRSDAEPRVLVACRRCTMLRGKETWLPFALCSMAARTLTKLRLTARLRSRSPFSTPSGTLRWN